MNESYSWRSSVFCGMNGRNGACALISSHLTVEELFELRNWYLLSRRPWRSAWRICAVFCFFSFLFHVFTFWIVSSVFFEFFPHGVDDELVDAFGAAE